MRRPLLIGNWKLHKTRAEARAFHAELRALGPQTPAIELGLAPPTTALATLADEHIGELVALCAQHCDGELAGSYTGATSAALLRDAGARYVLLGHSESRAHLGVTDAHCARAVAAAHAADLVPVLCIGESQATRARGETHAALAAQVSAGLADFAHVAGPLVLAYEPVWAIGQPQAAAPALVADVLAHLRQLLRARLPAGQGDAVRLLYGGGLKVGDVPALLALAELDGLLVGGQSLAAASFVAMARAMAAARPGQDAAGQPASAPPAANR